jgi:hypothetical protein
MVSPPPDLAPESVSAHDPLDVANAAPDDTAFPSGFRVENLAHPNVGGQEKAKL